MKSQNSIILHSNIGKRRQAPNNIGKKHRKDQKSALKIKPKKNSPSKQKSNAGGMSLYRFTETSRTLRSAIKAPAKEQPSTLEEYPVLSILPKSKRIKKNNSKQIIQKAKNRANEKGKKWLKAQDLHKYAKKKIQKATTKSAQKNQPGKITKSNN